MGEIVAGFGVPHSPHAPEQVRKDNTHPAVPLYAQVAAAIEAARLDALIVFDCDHFATFFLDNLPIFAIGVAERTAGPNDGTVMPRYDKIPVHGALAAHLRQGAIAAGFDVSLLQDFEIDHSILVPLHFMTPRMSLPIVPVFINCFVPPLPSARRCYALGQAVRDAVKSFPGALRVAVMGSGNFSLEIGGPKVAPGRRQGIPDPDWIAHVAERMQRGEIDRLLEEATTERMLQAGNVAGELLTWIAALGAIGGRKPEPMLLNPSDGEVYGIWGTA